MKKNIITLGSLLIAICSLSFISCMDDNEEPNVSDYMITSEKSVGSPTLSIKDFKEKYANLFSETNSFAKVETEEVIQGVVVANDQGGNLYQSIVLADCDGVEVDPTNCIQLAVKNTCLYPYFKMGQLVRVNLKDLYIGCYSKMPKIGQPYYTSSNNLRLGPMLLELCRTKVFLVGEASDYADKIYPVYLEENSELLTDKSYQNFMNAPMLVTVEGTFPDADGEAILAPDELKDAGYGVDRDFMIGKTKITVRTSTQNEVAFLVMPKEKAILTGVLSYYDGWQLQLRSVNDMAIIVTEDFGEVEETNNNE